MTSIKNLLSMLGACGIELFLNDTGRLRYRGPQGVMTAELKREIAAHQQEISAAIRAPGISAAATEPPVVPEAAIPVQNGVLPAVVTLQQPPTRNDRWDGVTHKRPDCTAAGSWGHVWGGRFCSTCWPCTDLLAMVADSPATATDGRAIPVNEKNPIPIR
jgi:hypothetical protein